MVALKLYLVCGLTLLAPLSQASTIRNINNNNNNNNNVLNSRKETSKAKRFTFPGGGGFTDVDTGTLVQYRTQFEDRRNGKDGGWCISLHVQIPVLLDRAF